MSATSSRLLPVLCLLGNACVWGLIWWPLRTLSAQHWHPLWSTVAMLAIAALALLLVRPASIMGMGRYPQVWLVALASGLTNGAFNWGIASGDVVRVVLLFYLMPVWAVMLARVMLHEPITPLALGRIAAALGGALLVLHPASGGLPVPATLAEWLGVVGGMAFALNNVLIRRQSAVPEDVRSLAMFLGGVAIPLAAAIGLYAAGAIALPPLPDLSTALLLAGLGLAMTAANIALQHGAANLPANVTAVVMLTEVAVAGLSAVVIGRQTVDARTLAGACLILGASALAAWETQGTE